MPDQNIIIIEQQQGVKQETPQAKIPKVPKPKPLSVLEDLSKIHPKESKGIFASANELYNEAIFGRDTIEVLRDLIRIKREESRLDQVPAKQQPLEFFENETLENTAREVIKTIAHLQGIQRKNVTEEEPGRIHHEHRSMLISGKKISENSQRILKELSQKWGGTDQEMTYYGSIDATPLYVNLVFEYCQVFGKKFLDEKFIRKDGKESTIHESVRAAVGWLETRITLSDIGLVEFKTTNPKGIINQVWKDSDTSYIHTNGELANHKQPIAPIEVQGYAHDAFMQAAELFGSKLPEDAKRWQECATQLRKNTIELFWIPDEEYFAMGIDRDKQGRPRQIQTLSSNPALLLNTGIFDNLERDEKETYIYALVTKIMSQDFLTDAGIRSRALRYKNLVPFQDYHGAWTVWVKETYEVAQGLRRQGFNRFAEQLETRILNSVNIAGKDYEFFYVSPDGKVNYDPENRRFNSGRVINIFATNIPEGTQAWTVSAVLAIKYRLAHLHQNGTNFGWQSTLEKSILTRIPKREPLKTEAEIQQASPDNYRFEFHKTDQKLVA